MLIAATSNSPERTGAKPATYLNPAARASITGTTVGGVAVGLTVMATSDPMTAAYDTVSRAKHQPSPTAAMSRPPIAGPIMRLPLTSDELSAMALGRSARSSTIWTTNDWRAGVSNALTTPCSACKIRISVTVMLPVRVSSASAAD